MIKDPIARLILSVAVLASTSIFSTRLVAAQQAPTVLTAQDSVSLERTTLADKRIRAIVGPGQSRVIITMAELDKAEAEAFLADTSRPAPTRRAIVVVFNPETNRAAQAVVSLREYRILSVQSIPASDVPLVRIDADQALELAKASIAVRAAIGDSLPRFEILDSGEEASVPFVAQALPLRSSNPRDPCSRDRCLDLVFRTSAGYLPLRAHVNLTRRTVTVERRRPQ